jgi:hypothetical protein
MKACHFTNSRLAAGIQVGACRARFARRPYPIPSSAGVWELTGRVRYQVCRRRSVRSLKLKPLVPHTSFSGWIDAHG